MKFMSKVIFAAGERTLSNLRDWFQNGYARSLYPARGFGPAPIPLYIQRVRVHLNFSNSWEL